MNQKTFAGFQASFQDWRATTLSPLRFPAFRSLWMGSVALNVGAVIQMVGASWLMATLTSSADMVAFVQTANLAPMLLLALPAGALADTADRRRLMLFSQCFGALAAAGLFWAALAGKAGPEVLLLFTLLIGSAAALHMPSWAASFNDLVDRDYLPAAIALNALAYNLARSVGPAIGGVVVAAFGAPGAFAVNALSFLGLILALKFWRTAKPDETLPPEPIGRAMMSGVRYVMLSPSLLAIMARGGMVGFCAISVLALLPLIAKERLGAGPLTFGLLLAGFGVGSMIAALSSARLRQLLGAERLTNRSNAAFAIASMCLAFSNSTPLSIALLMICGGGWILSLATISTVFQMSCPRWVLGRSVALSQVTTIGGMSVGSATWGIVAKNFGVTEAILTSGALLLATLLLSRRLPLPGIDGFDFSAASLYNVPAPGTPLDARTGPIVVMVEYRVPMDRAAEFLNAIHELGRIRQRDGARRWSIVQDIDDPEVWHERYQSPTWLDHLRRVSRLTVHDQKLRDRVASFHLGAAPVTRRLLEREPNTEPMGAVDAPPTAFPV